MPEIRLENLSKRFGSLMAVEDVSYTFANGKVTCLLGPSGCGKTTLMRMIAGLETQSSGRIFIGTEEVSEKSVQARNIGMVFQYPVVYRGMSVYKNIELPLKGTGLTRQEREKTITEAAEMLELKDVLHEHVERIDSVSRQKTAVAREVARRPEILLFDEPLTNVDSASKYRFQRAFKTLTRATSQTIVYVTHDQTEAMTLADRIALMEKGKIIQDDSPRAVYGTPQNTFAGWFLGNPGMNFIKLENGGSTNGLAAFLMEKLRLGAAGSAQGLTFGIRPEDVLLSETPKERWIKARVVRSVIAIGGQLLMTLDIGGARLKAKTRYRESLESLAEAWIDFSEGKVLVFGPDTTRISRDGARHEPTA